MDPDAALEEIRELVRASYDNRALDWDDAMRFAELVDGLDHWLVRCGALPTGWRNAK